MLDQLFGSAQRMRLLDVLLLMPEPLTAADLARASACPLRRTHRELAALAKLGLAVALQTAPRSAERRSEVRYQAAAGHELYPELRSLAFKSQLLTQRSLLAKLAKNPAVKLAVLTGRFVDRPELGTDLLVVGRLPKAKLANLLRQLQRRFLPAGEEFRYTLLTPTEYRYRYSITDRFLYGIFSVKHVVIVDRLRLAR